MILTTNEVKLLKTFKTFFQNAPKWGEIRIEKTGSKANNTRGILKSDIWNIYVVSNVIVLKYTFKLFLELQKGKQRNILT